MALFRAGHDEAFRVIHDRYRQRLFAYTRQMLPHRPDAEDALQDIFVRAYSGLRANRRELALRAWLYRVAHNRCIDELRRPAPPPPEVIHLLRAPVHDPIAEADQRESLRRLIADVRRLPDQQRSALLMRELGGMSYADLAAALGVTVPAVKSLLVRARLALAQALEARDTACSDIREELVVAHDRGLRPGATARRHMRDCSGCREFRVQLRGVSRRLGAIVPTLGPLGVLANVLGIGGAGSGAAGGALAAGGVAGTSTAVVSVGTLSAGAGHVATLLAAAVVTAGGAVELQQNLPAPVHHHHARTVRVAPARPAAPTRVVTPSAESNDAAPTLPSLPLVARTQTPAGLATGDSARASTKPAATPTSLSTTTTTPVKVKVRATGGISTTPGNGGVSPTAPSDSSSTGATAGSTTTPTLTSTSSSTSTSTGTPSTESGATAGSSTPTTPESSSATTQPTSSSSTSTGATSTGATTGTGSSTTGTAPGGSPPPTQ
ncbi:MAG TPA: sigma-70 family RNA polymerase sigma factor [Solirubrobacteraceae bacterium]|nr:sigma-70 family RNA polymerase sigma factor [Solirubrobacteraceae bacterium]